MDDAPASPEVAATLLSQPSSRLLEHSAAPEAHVRAEVMDLISAATALPASSLDPHMALVELGVGSLQVRYLKLQCVALTPRLYYHHHCICFG